MSSTDFYVAKDVTYKLPQGCFEAIITSVEEKPVKGADDGRKNIIIYFEVFIKGMERFECCARACFPDDESRNSDLRAFLEKLLGKQFLAECAAQTINLKTILIGKRCAIELVHGKHDKKFDWPLVVVENIWPMTELVKKGEIKK